MLYVLYIYGLYSFNQNNQFVKLNILNLPFCSFNIFPPCSEFSTMQTSQSTKMFYSASKSAQTCDGNVMFDITIHGIIDYCITKIKLTCF